jgi:hypothetical protein
MNKRIRYIFQFYLIIVAIYSCSITRIKRDFHYDSEHDFTYFQTSDTIMLKLTDFYKNNVYCYTEAIPYALLIGKPVNSSNLPRMISILAHCDNNEYRLGDTLKIVQIDNPESKISLHKLSITKDTIIQGKRIMWLIGSEYPGTWGKVIK